MPDPCAPVPPAHRHRRFSWRPAAVPALVLVLAALLPGLAEARQLLDVRFGRHQDRVRAVLDLDAAAPFTQALSADGLTVTIDLVETEITAAAGHHPLSSLAPITGFDVAPAATPTTAEVRIEASRPVRVLAVEDLPAGAGVHHRIAIDLAQAPAAAPAAPAPAAATPRPAPAAVPAPAPPPPPPPPPPAPATGAPAAPAALGPGHPLEVPAAARAPAPPAAAADPARIQEIRGLLEQARQAQDSHDDARAFALYRTAADAGSPEAAFAIGQMYRLGAGIAANPTLAAFWYGEAARTGYPPAEMNLGVMELRGIGINADPATGLALIRRAAAHGNQAARDLLDDLARTEESRAGAGHPGAGHP